MSGSSTARNLFTGIPSANSIVINDEGTPTQVWYQFWLGLWNRTGQAAPAQGQSVFLVESGTDIVAYNAATGERIGPIGGVNLIETSYPISGGPITRDGTIGMAESPVDIGDYHLANISVNKFGLITDASNGVVDLAADVTGQLPLTNLADIADVTLLGNDSGAAAPPSEITIGAGLALASSVLSLALPLDGLAAAGTTQADGYALGHGVYTFTTVAAGALAAVLPNTPGNCVVMNRDAADALSLFPPVGGQIEAAGLNTAVSVTAVNGSLQLFSADGLLWRSIP